MENRYWTKAAKAGILGASPEGKGGAAHETAACVHARLLDGCDAEYQPNVTAIMLHRCSPSNHERKILKMKKFLATLISALLVLTLTVPALAAEPVYIGIPDDGTNLSRGIKLLETAGLITVDPEAGYTPEIADITGYLYNIEVMPVSANTLASTLDDYAASTINGTYAVPYGLIPSRDGLIIESQADNGENPYVNNIAARTADKDNEIYKTIVDAFQTQLVAEYLLAAYNEVFYPAFDYDPEFTVAEDFVDSITNYVSPREGKTVVKVGVCGANNNQWYAVQKVLDDQGANIYIELVEFDAYNLPNDALNSGEIDLNSFQHLAYLNSEIAINGYDLTAIGDTLIAPLTLYSKKVDSLDALKELAGKLE